MSSTVTGRKTTRPEQSSGTSPSKQPVTRRELTSGERKPGTKVKLGDATQPWEPPPTSDTESESLASQINELHRRVVAATRRSEVANKEAVYGAIEAGELLIEEKEPAKCVPYAGR